LKNEQQQAERVYLPFILLAPGNYSFTSELLLSRTGTEQIGFQVFPRLEKLYEHVKETIRSMEKGKSDHCFTRAASRQFLHFVPNSQAGLRIH
jgi:hypothetical protein